jgi:centrosomal protein CEP350
LCPQIQELQQAQVQEQLPYFYIREIPNKPPPPYTPPGQTTRIAAACIPLSKQDLTSEEEPHFIPSTAEELTSLTVEVTSYLYNLQAAGGDIEHAEVPPEFYENNNTANLSDIKRSSRWIFKKLIFDLTKDLVKEAYGWVRDKPCAPWDWPAFSHRRSKMPPRSKEMLQEVVLKQVLVLFGFAPKTHKEKLVIRWSRKKRDYVDEILMKESHEEESAWTNYDEDEVAVKNEIALGLLDSLLDETVQIILDIRKAKLNKS